MVVDHGLLHRMQAVIAGEAFNRDELLAVECRQELDARVDGPNRYVIALSIQFRNDDGAGAAVTLGAAFLGAGTTEILAQELQHGPRRVYVGEFIALAVENETNGIERCIDSRAPLAHSLNFPGRSSNSTATPATARDNARLRARQIE